MRVLLTGAKGFIGGHILRSLHTRHTMFAPTHNELDLLDENDTVRYFKAHPVDVVIHCAVIGGNTPKLWVKNMFHDNLRMFFNIAGCGKYFKRLINIGSGAEYDKRHPIVDVREGDLGVHIPSDDYGLYKYICANFISSQNNMTDLRIFGIFGEGEEYRQRFISNALCRHMYGLPITIRQNVYFNYLDVTDFVKIIEYFIDHKPKFTSYNIGTEKKLDLVSIAREIVKLSGSSDHPILVKQKGYANEYTCNTRRLFSEVKGLKTTPFVQSLTRLSAWYYLRKEHIIKSQL